MPIYNPGSGFRPGSGYGPRIPPVPDASRYHRAQDFPSSTGTSIPSAANGTVCFSGSLAGYGNTVLVEHNINGEKVYTLYAHLNEPSSLRKSDTVNFEVIKDQPNPLKKGHNTYDPSSFDFPGGGTGGGTGGSGSLRAASGLQVKTLRGDRPQ